MSGARHIPNSARHSLSRAAQKITAESEPFLAVRSLATNYFSGFRIELHRHNWHQFLYATSGAMTVSTPQSSWMIPTGRAIFIPSQCDHTIRMWGTVEMRSLYLSQELTGWGDLSCRVVEVMPLLRELILRTADLHALDSRTHPDSHIIGLLEEEIGAAMAAASDSPLSLPMPAEGRTVALAQHVVDNPSLTGTIDGLARQHGLARRTLERRFREETGMSFGMWRQKARLLHSIRLLAEGRSVTDTALDCGYASLSAFIAAFKGTFGYTPGRM